MGHKILGEGAPHGEGKHFSRGRGGGGGDIVNFIFLKLGGGGSPLQSFPSKGKPCNPHIHSACGKTQLFLWINEGHIVS